MTGARRRTRILALSLVAISAATVEAQTQQPKASMNELATKVETVAKQIEAARNNIDLVEKQYTLREEMSDEVLRMQRFSDGEIQYLLGDYATASVLFYDLVANVDFQANRKYADALFYLADSLYQLKNYLGARLYLRQLLSLKQGHYKEALARYLEIAGRLNEFVGIDEYINQARGLSGGTLPPELTYVYAKWLFRRQDLPLSERVSRAQGIFNTLASTEGGPFRFQSAYFIGVGYVRVKEWAKAIEQFNAVTKLVPRDDKDRKVLELADMSLGRVYFETGQYDEAIDHYAKVSQSSENFPDSLYEVAWTYVRKGELAKAKNATDILLLVAEDSVLAPEARILQGTLLQKLSQYDDAIGTYNQVINQYLPIADNLEELIKVANPEQYFDQMLTRNDKSLDVTKLLPPEALKWASTRDDVAQAVEITGSLDASRKGLVESRQIAQRILKSLDERGVESFPTLQEGYTRADAVETAIARAEEALTSVEGSLVEGVLAQNQRRVISEAKARQLALKQRIDTLPTTVEQVKARKDRIQGAIDVLDRQAFQAGIEIQSQNAQLTAIRKFVDDTRAARKGKTNPEDEKAFLERVSNEQRALDGMQAQVEEFRATLLDERTNADKAISGEDALRKEYASMLQDDRAVFSQARGALGAEPQKIMLRSDVVRADAAAVRDRVVRSKAIIRERVEKRAQKLREQVLLEQGLIEGYARDTEAITGETRNLVGRIAFESFKRVHQSFYDLVLKANVGVVDVSFQRKQDKTSQIQKLAAQKDRELKQLDDEFKEVLRDVE